MQSFFLRLEVGKTLPGEVVATSSSSPDERRRRYEDIVFQITREDTLVNFRLTWSITLNGAMFAALWVLLAKSEAAGLIYRFADWLLPISGFFISLVGLLGVYAAQRQIEYLTKEWGKLGDNPWPRPFGDPLGFRIGTLPSIVPPLIFTLAWMGVLVWLGPMDGRSKLPIERTPVCASHGYVI